MVPEDHTQRAGIDCECSSNDAFQSVHVGMMGPLDEPRTPPRAALARGAIAALSNAGIVSLLCRSRLGFESIPHESGMTLVKRIGQTYALLRIDWVGSAKKPETDAPIGALTLSPACFVSYLPALQWTGFSTAIDLGGSFGRVGLAVDREVAGAHLRFPNMWWAGDDLSPSEDVIVDIMKNIEESMLPFFTLCSDPGAFLHTLVEPSGANMEPRWDVGQPGSLRRILFQGYAALALCEWQTAGAYLEICREKLTAVRSLGGDVFYAQYSGHIDKGLECVATTSQWLPESASIKAWQEGPRTLLSLVARPCDRC